MPIEVDKTCYDANEEYDSWNKVVETMNNYQEWDDLPIVLVDTDKNKPIHEHIEPDFHDGKHPTGRLKSSISAFITGYQLLHSMFYKIIYIMLFCTFKASVITSKILVYVFETFSEVVISTSNALSNWINKPRIQYTRKQRKTSNGSGNFPKFSRKQEVLL